MFIIEKARTFAMAAHAATGQLRKYTHEPYFVHVEEVAQIVMSTSTFTEEMVAAAYLHDTVEDTAVTIDLIEREFGSKVAELVGWLTDVSKPEDGNRAHRKALDRAHSAAAPADAQTVKLADLISNSRSITQCDPEFAATYLEEKRLLLEVMDKGDAALTEMARGFIGE